MRHCTQGLLPFLVRLACVKRAASVDSEPGSNSRLILLFEPRTTAETARALLGPETPILPKQDGARSGYYSKV